MSLNEYKVFSAQIFHNSQSDVLFNVTKRIDSMTLIDSAIMVPHVGYAV